MSEIYYLKWNQAIIFQKFLLFICRFYIRSFQTESIAARTGNSITKTCPRLFENVLTEWAKVFNNNYISSFSTDKRIFIAPSCYRYYSTVKNIILWQHLRTLTAQSFCMIIKSTFPGWTFSFPWKVTNFPQTEKITFNICNENNSSLSAH